MDTQAIEEAIDKYVNERMEKGKKRACERFLSYVYLKHTGEDFHEFMQNVRGLTRYYIDFLKVMENPFKGPELPWFASMITVAVASCLLMKNPDLRLLGILVFSGTAVSAWQLLRETARKWRELEVMIAIYREIAELAEYETCDRA